jgi:hypothetical protein
MFNPQQQFPVTWPAEPVVARAYVDQLRRGDSVRRAVLTDVEEVLDLAAARLASGSADSSLATRLQELADRLGPDGDPLTQKRKTALAATLSALAQRLR